MERIREELYLEEQEEANRQREIVRFHLDKKINVQRCSFCRSFFKMGQVQTQYFYFETLKQQKGWLRVERQIQIPS